MLRVSKATARRAIFALEHFEGDVSRLIHDTRIGLESIRPYTDRNSSAVLEVFELLQRAERRGKAPRAVFTLEAIAEGN